MDFYQARLTMPKKTVVLPHPTDDERLQISTAFGDSMLVVEYVSRIDGTVQHAVFLGEFDQRPC